MLTNSSSSSVSPDIDVTNAQSDPISLLNVAYYYSPIDYPHQAIALDWLNNQLADSVSLEFFHRWQNTFHRQYPQLKQGAISDVVVELQHHLNRWGANLITDGAFGARTRSAVVAFQQRRKLVPDGIVGPRTWTELIKPSQVIRLSQMLRSYNPSLYPQHNRALEWLQRQIREAVLAEFAKRWREQES